MDDVEKFVETFEAGGKEAVVEALKKGELKSDPVLAAMLGALTERDELARKIWEESDGDLGSFLIASTIVMGLRHEETMEELEKVKAELASLKGEG